MANNAQCSMILDHMRNIGPITQDDASKLYGCVRLPARINDLRKQGHIITTIMTHGVNRFGKKITYASYMLMGGK